MNDYQELDKKYVAYLSGSTDEPWKSCYKYYHGKICIDADVFVELFDEHDDYEYIGPETVFDTEEDCKKFIKEKNFELLKWATEQATYIVEYMKTF